MMAGVSERLALVALAAITALAVVLAPWAAINRETGARSAVVSVVISCRSTAAAPLIPPPAVLICRAAAFMSSARLMVVAWRSPAGPARLMSSR